LPDISDIKHQARLSLVSQSWRASIIKTDKGANKDCRENIIYVLTQHPEWSGVIGADEFAKRIVVRAESPIGHLTGDEWNGDHDAELAMWLHEQCDLQIRSLDTVAQAVRYAAKKNTFHPVREFLDGLEWDGQSRIDDWVCRYLGADDTQYHRLVGRFFLINLVRRIYEPGCVMRSVPVLEGTQDIGKSRALRAIGGKWFSDTMFKVGDKDSYQQIQGVWLYEISEMEGFTRSEATAVKAFISSTEDNFRAPYERQNEKHKRQTVFAASTNAAEYLKDWTGNTRFWPIACIRVDLDGLHAVREQLLAESLALYRQGERTYPTAEQQRDLFEIEQARRTMGHPWLDMVGEYLHALTKDTVTVREVMADGLGIDLSRINPQGSEAQRVGQILAALGWSKQRASAFGDETRRWEWQRPGVSKVVQGVSKLVQGGDNSKCPF